MRPALRAAAGGTVDIAFDMVSGARDRSSTLAALSCLRRGDRLVLMGSMTVDLPISYYTTDDEQSGDHRKLHAPGERLSVFETMRNIVKKGYKRNAALSFIGAVMILS